MPVQRREVRNLTLVLFILAIFVFPFSSYGQVLCRFAVAGDVRPALAGKDSINPNPKFLRLIEAVNLLSPDLILLTGDLIHGGNTNQPATLTQMQWNAFDLAKKKFTMPLYLVAGNHDVWDNASAKMYVDHCGPMRYAFESKGVYFIVLDVYGKTISETQVRWLADQLKIAGTKPTFVFLHVPLWWPGGRLHGQAASDHPLDEFWAKNVHPLLVGAKNVQAVIASHEHFYVHQKFDGIDYIISGGGGAETRGPLGELTGAFGHFLMVSPQNDKTKTRIAVLPVDGVKAANFMQPDQRYEMLDRLTALQNWPEVDTGQPVNVQHRVELKNPFTEGDPMEVEIFAVVDPESGWKIAPIETRVKIAPGQSTTLKWQIRSPKVASPSPTFLWKIHCGNRQAEGEGNLWIH